MSNFYIDSKYARSETIARRLVDIRGLRLFQNNPDSLMLQIRTRTEKQGRMALCPLTKQQCLDLADKLREFAVGLE